ncbi:nuclear transcription factor Y subunit C-4 [Stachybotrys elegans]|uniref:Nuclear transcription factor Y subunit C-4 n=1 Tax=Stachybotrys elegans TaxID=80388 RepID=A0A8K0SKT1_9HYPO|nr:nuclear transcription factor Y subunit C-4 [Stachybotrys elegans]
MDPPNPSASSHPQQGRAAPVYDPNTQGGHYGACATLAGQGFAPAELYTGPWANVHQGLTGQYKDILTTYWQQTISHLESDSHDYKIHQLPLARIKKVMKADPEVKMISAEAPILFAKGCDIFITELTMRAWIHAEENKRRTLQRSDIASALAKSDMFDFLIDIVPREEAASHAKRTSAQSASAPQAVPAPPGQAQMPGQHANMGQPGSHSSHPMGPADYMGGHALGGPDPDYRQQPNMYPGQVPQGPSAPYGQAQPPMYGEMEGMYGYSAMQPQQAPMASEEFE